MTKRCDFSQRVMITSLITIKSYCNLGIFYKLLMKKIKYLSWGKNFKNFQI